MRITILTFHGIGPPLRPLDDGEDHVWISAELFRAVLDLVQHRADVKLTFDDGNASDVHLALPELRCRGMTATFFPVAGRLGQRGFLNVSDIQQLAKEGMALGSHGMDHVPWHGLPTPALSRETRESREVLSDIIGAPIISAACPFGSYGRRVLDALRNAGYREVFTSDRGLAFQGRLIQPRNSIHHSDTLADVAAMLDGTMRPSGLAHRAKLLLKRWR